MEFDVSLHEIRPFPLAKTKQTKNGHKRNICVRHDVRLQTHIREAETGVNYIGSSKATTVKPNQKINPSKKNTAGHGGSGL